MAGAMARAEVKTITGERKQVSGKGLLYSFLSFVAVIAIFSICIAVGEFIENGTFDLTSSAVAAVRMIGYIAAIALGVCLIACSFQFLPVYRRTVFFFALIFLSAVMHKYFWTPYTKLGDVAVVCTAGAAVACFVVALVHWIDRREKRRDAERFYDS